MNIIYLGTPEFAVAPLEAIISSDKHKVVGVVTQPDRPVGRKAVITPPPVKVAAQKAGIPVFQFEKIRTEGVDALKNLGADIMITCAYGQILSKEVLDICPFGVYNLHGSLLPKYRGASPIQYAVINGDKKTGITVMKTDVGMDTGDILKEYELEILPDETYGELANRLSVLAAEVVVPSLDLISENHILKRQDDSISSVVKPIKKEDSIIDFTNNSETVKNFINGLNPSPVARTWLYNKTLKIFKASKADFSGKAGEVVKCDDELIVACGAGSIIISELQEEGGKRMSACDFIRGRKIKLGDKLGKGND
ncbi:MAG: methionyl-tRNA formyltransferase [Clostridia bacterium]|nr:methionyl-tRNA formyltransferase [Clostridia bacterium]